MDRVGLIAGNSDYPFFFVAAAREKGINVIAAAIRGETDKRIESAADIVQWFYLGQLKKLIQFFKDNNVKKCVMAGGVKKVRIFKEILHMDFEAVKLVSSLKDKTDTSLLGAICERLKQDGIEVISSATFLEDFLAQPGILTKNKPSPKQNEDILFGKDIAKNIASMDIGLTVVVKDKVVLAVEAVEGTDQAVSRGAKLGGPGAVVIKVARPLQDERFDLPVIGLNTIELLKNENIACIGIEAGKTLIFDKENVIALAEKSGIAIVGIE